MLCIGRSDAGVRVTPQVPAEDQRRSTDCLDTVRHC